jgi:hypothetical protein
MTPPIIVILAETAVRSVSRPASFFRRLHKEGLKLLAGTLSFREGEKARLCLRGIVLVLVVVFVRHYDSVLAIAQF